MVGRCCECQWRSEDMALLDDRREANAEAGPWQFLKSSFAVTMRDPQEFQDCMFQGGSQSDDMTCWVLRIHHGTMTVCMSIGSP